ncbi:MAG: lectin-like domain-containing protein [Bacillota bacterium]
MSPSVLVEGLQPNTEYLFRVIDSNLRGEVVAQFSAKTADVPPGNLTITQGTPAADTNLTTGSNLDWAHWGYNQSATGYDVRYYGSNRISNYQLIGTATATAYNAAGATFTWTDGRPNSDAQEVTVPTDPIEGFSSEIPAGQTSAWPAGENPTRVIDNQTGTKFLNFNEVNCGIIVTPSAGATVINAIGLTSANDAPERDPSNYVVEGSNDGGTTWTKITEGVVPAFTARGQKQVFRFENTKSYKSYKVTFPTVQNAMSANSFQIDEIDLYKSNMYSVAATDDAVAVAGQGNGFKFTVPAQPANRQLKVYVAVDGDAQGQLTASLSDMSVPVKQSEILNAGGSLKTAVYTIDYRSGLAGKELTIEWKSVGGTGNVILQAATLSDVDPVAAPTDVAVDGRFVGGVVVSWKDNSANELGYRVERTLAGADNWTVLATVPANITTYTDKTAEQGKAYQYRVTTFNPLGSISSTAANVTTAAIPEGWEGKTIGTTGDPSYPGEWGYDATTGTWSIRISSGDVWGNNNHFFYAYQPIHGDVRMTARVTGMTNTTGWAKGGVMLSESLAPNSRFLSTVATPGNAVHVQGWDGADIDAGTWGTNMTAANAVNWVRIERLGNTVTSYYSADGVTWTTCGSRTVDWGTDIYLGLSYTTNNNSSIGVATFDNVSIDDIEDVVPVAPTDANAAAISGNRVVVTWKDNANNETGYVLQRRSGASAWEDVDANLAPNTTFYVDYYADDGKSYTYRVYAKGLVGDSDYSNNTSNVKSGVGTTPVGDNWQSIDIGAPYYNGSDGYLNNVYDVTGGGGDIWGTESDSFHFVYQEMSGDFVISGIVFQQERSSDWAKAGFMIRTATDDGYGNIGLDPAQKGAPMAYIMATPDHGLQYGWRTTLKGNCGEATSPTQGTPAYIRLARVNGLVTAWMSEDGTIWSQLGQSQNIGNDTVYVGMAVTSHDDTKTSLVTFKDVAVTTYDGTVTPEAPSDLKAVALGAKDVVLTWTDHSISETGFKIQRSTNGVDGWTTISEVGTSVTRFVDRNAGGQTYYYRVAATNTTAATPDSAYTEVVMVAPGVDGTPIHMSDFADASGWQLNGKATVSNNVLRITDAVNDQLSSAFTKLPQNLNNFKASFDMLMSGGTGADGMAFVIQANDPTVLGGGGGSLGYTGIGYSIAIKFDIYKNGGHDIDETGLYINGDNPQYDEANDAKNEDIDLRPTLGNLLDTKWHVALTYENGKLTMTMAKADAPETILFTNTWDIDIPATFGMDSGFVGFTGATGGANVKQEIYNFNFGPIDEVPPTGDWVINGTDSDDVRTLKRVGDNVQLLDAAGNVLEQKPFAGITNIVVNGKGGNDTLILDYSGGELVATAKNVTFDGGDGNDLVKLAANAGSNALVINAAGVSFGGRTINLANVESKGLALSGNAAVSLAKGSAALKLGSLSLSENATLDLADNDLIVTATPETKEAVLAAIATAIRSARGDGSWTGKGLTSSEARAMKEAMTDFTGLAVVLNDAGGEAILNSFDGQTVGLNDILVKYTWNGDVDLNGIVDGDDYFLIDAGFISGLDQYRNGDVDLNGVIDGDDYFLVDAAFISQGAPLAAAPAQPAASVLATLFSVKPIL